MATLRGCNSQTPGPFVGQNAAAFSVSRRCRPLTTRPRTCRSPAPILTVRRRGRRHGLGNGPCANEVVRLVAPCSWHMWPWSRSICTSGPEAPHRDASGEVVRVFDQLSRCGCYCEVPQKSSDTPTMAGATPVAYRCRVPRQPPDFAGVLSSTTKRHTRCRKRYARRQRSCGPGREAPAAPSTSRKPELHCPYVAQISSGDTEFFRLLPIVELENLDLTVRSR